MIITTETFKNISDQKGKIIRMKRSGELIQLKRGVYETEKNTPGYCLAGAIFGPSYLSFDYALSYYGLIPEAVYAYTSATFGKKKAKEVENPFGRFLYLDVPPEAYPFGIVIKEENGYVYQMACPEKALCDKLYRMPPVTTKREIEQMLFEDLRFYETEFANLDANTILQIGEKYHSSNLEQLMKYLRRAAK